MSGAPATILVIDDVESSRAELSRMVESLGHRACAAQSGMEGLRIAREVRPSLVLLDVVMPGMDGFKIAAAFKAQPSFVPVMLLTALDDLDTKRRGQAAGADDFLTKPVHPIELQIRIAAMLRIKSLTDALDGANRRLAELADTDALTGVANRRRFDALYAIEHERAGRYRRPLSVLMIDVDYFKRINDDHGHATGDVVLRAVAQSLAQSVRGSDHLGRVGGEEFVVLAPEVGASGALVLGERLRNRVAEIAIDSNGAVLRPTVSIGVVAWDGLAYMERAALLAAADDALYQAKARGRNRCILTSLAVPAP